MKKTLISLSLAALFGSSAAFAEDITIYGSMHYSLDYVTADPGFADDGDWATGVNRASFIGVKGSEDLGNGLKAIFKIESNINGAVGSWNTYAGLTGDWGTVIMGQHDTPYLISTEGMDLFVDTVADYNAVMGTANGGVAFNNVAPQTIAYISPNMSGLTIAAALVSTSLDEGAGNEETEGASVAAMYSNNGLYATLAWEGFNDGANALGCGLGIGVCGTGGSDAWKGGLGYSNDQFSLGFVYENIDAGALDQDNWLINGSYTFGNNVLKAEYGESDVNIVNADYDFWAVGLDHNLSKRTKVYALYTSLDNDTAGAGGLNAGSDVGSVHYTTGAGVDRDAFSVGIIHNF